MDIEAIKDLRNKLPDNWKWHKCYELPYVNSRTGREFNLKHWALTAPDVKGVVCSIGLISHDHHTETHKKFLENDVPVEWVEKSLLIVDSLLRELEVLRRWKAEAIEVMPDMQAIGKALGLRIGESVHDKILPGIEKLKQKAATPTIGARWVRASERVPEYFGTVHWRDEEGVPLSAGAAYHAVNSGRTEVVWWLDESPATFPTRERAQEWAGQFADKVAFRVPYNGSNYFNDDNHHKWASEAALAMYDWIMSKTTTQ